MVLKKRRYFMARRPPEENHSTCRFQRMNLVYGERTQYGTRHEVNFLGNANSKFIKLLTKVLGTQSDYLMSLKIPSLVIIK